ncbi:MAG: adenylate/guanylate cyclase domain-containing protein [Candidatus Zixiibacteriota bacterium]|nr:MAG: adenylate/guanylate cyclase domain-containing protein [candidate division Zixibacteria bacterium]
MKLTDRFFRPLSFFCVLCLGILSYYFEPSVVSRLALPLEDFKFAVRERLDSVPVSRDDIVIVAVDEKSVNRLGRWPWDHHVMGDLLRHLGSARLVGLDMVFADPTSPEEDRALAEAMADSENVIAGFFFRSQATNWTSLADLDQLAEWAFRDVQTRDEIVGVKDYPFVETNLPEIGASALSGGFFNGEPDLDGLYRKYPLAALHKGYLVPSLAVQMLRFQRNQEPRVVLDRHGVSEFVLGSTRINQSSLRLNFGLPAQAKFLSVSDVIDGTIPEDYFRGKIVLVGITEVGIFDLRPTPVDPVIPGVWIHYTALANLLDDRILSSVPAIDLLILVGALLLAWLICRLRRISLRVVLYMLVTLTVLVVANSLLLFCDIWTREFFVLIPYFLFTVALEAHGFFRSELRAGELKRAFISYVSPEVVREILEHPEKLDLGGVEREVSILFSDIRGFTSLSEKVSAPQLVKMLNAIHDPMTQIVLEQRGMLDKYIGDAMMALFNTPVPVQDHPDRAVEAALGMVAALKDINAGFAEQGLPEIDVGVGVNTGLCVVGNMGSRVRFEYTAIGDAVNLASRLEGLCKVYKTRIVISEFTRERLQHDFVTRLLDRVRVKGKHIPVGVYEVMADSEKNRVIQSRFGSALEAYFAGSFTEAREEFSSLVKTYDDQTSIIFEERCRSFISNPPPAGWDGVYDLTIK